MGAPAGSRERGVQGGTQRPALVRQGATEGEIRGRHGITGAVGPQPAEGAPVLQDQHPPVDSSLAGEGAGVGAEGGAGVGADVTTGADSGLAALAGTAGAPAALLALLGADAGSLGG